jgi:RNA polymerase sigma factor (sigma-70 family)
MSGSPSRTFQSGLRHSCILEAKSRFAVETCATVDRYPHEFVNGDSHMEAAGAAFATTHWSVVLAAGRDSTPSATDALEKLCRTYWYPLYSYVRRKGHNPEDAQDLTQDFFARLLSKKYLRLADPARGRFRAFLLTSLKHFLIHQWEKGRTARRGGDQQVISLNEQEAESRYHLEPSSQLSPEMLYDRHWALTLFERALDQLKSEFIASGKVVQFDRLKGFLSSESNDGAYAAAGSELGTSAKAVAVAVHRLRSRYGELVRAEIAHTVPTSAEIGDELHYLMSQAVQGG